MTQVPSGRERPVRAHTGADPAVVELLRDHVTDWGGCDRPDECNCSHARATAFLARYDEAQRVRAEQFEQRRREHMAVEVHYVAHPGDRQVLCQVRVEDVPHGWIGPEREYVFSRLSNGGAVCPDCLAALNSTLF